MTEIQSLLNTSETREGQCYSLLAKGPFNHSISPSESREQSTHRLIHSSNHRKNLQLPRHVQRRVQSRTKRIRHDSVEQLHLRGRVLLLPRRPRKGCVQLRPARCRSAKICGSLRGLLKFGHDAKMKMASDMRFPPLQRALHCAQSPRPGTRS